MTYITSVEKTDDRHRSKWIIHNGWQWILAEFNRESQLKEFAKQLGFTYELREEESSPTYGVYRKYDMSHQIDDKPHSFFTLAELPEGVQPIKALSNGSIVTCYHRIVADRIEIYRPNPNAAPDVYDPLPISEHIGHVLRFGNY